MLSNLINTLFLISLVVCAPLNAQAATDSGSENNFNNQNSISNIFNDKILSSIAKIHFRNGHCTGAFVSDEGHFLTAHHCLIDNGYHPLKSSEEMMTSTKLEGQFSISLSNDDQIYSRKYKIVSMGAGPIPTSQARYLSIYGFREDNYTLKMINDIIEKDIGSQSDWIIVKIDMGDVSYGCLPVTKDIKEPLIATGHPGFARPYISKVTKSGFSFSIGDVISPSSCEDLTRPFITYDNYEKLNKPSLDQSRILISSARVEQGMSGGPVLNDKGELNSIISANPYLCKQKTSILVPLTGIEKQIDSLNKKLPSITENSETIFRCSPN